jgi:hypothetical protein
MCIFAQKNRLMTSDMLTIDTTNLCSHLQKKLFEENGIYHPLWIAMQDDNELTTVVRSRQLHIYRNAKKVLVLAGKSAPKIIREDPICELLQTTNEASAESSSLELCLARRSCDEIEIERIKSMEQRFNHALAAIKDGSAVSLKAIKEDVAELSKYYGSELWKLDLAADEAGKLPPDLKRGVLSEDGIWNLLSEYHEIQETKQ